MASQYFKAKDAKANVVSADAKKTKVFVFPKQGEKLYEDVMRTGRKPVAAQRVIKLRGEKTEKPRREIMVKLKPTRGKKTSKAQQKIQQALEKRQAVKEARQAPVLNVEQLAMRRQVEERIAKREEPQRIQKAIEAAKVPSQTFGIARAPLAIEATAKPDKPAKAIRGVEVEGVVETKYAGLKKAQLQAEAKKRGVSSKGNKDDIIASLVINDRRSEELARPALEGVEEPFIQEIGEEPFQEVKSKSKKKKDKKQTKAEAEQAQAQAEEERLLIALQEENDQLAQMVLDAGYTKEQIRDMAEFIEKQKGTDLYKARLFSDELRFYIDKAKRQREYEEEQEARARMGKADILGELKGKQAEKERKERYSAGVEAVLEAQKKGQEPTQAQKRNAVLEELNKRPTLEFEELPSREEILSREVPKLTKTERANLTASELSEIEERYGLSSEGNVKERRERLKALQEKQDITPAFGSIQSLTSAGVQPVFKSQKEKEEEEEFARNYPQTEISLIDEPLLKSVRVPTLQPEILSSPFEGLDEPLKSELKAGALVGRHHKQMKRVEKQLGRKLQKKDIKKLQKAKMFGGALNGGGFTDTLLGLAQKGLSAAVDYAVKNPDKVLGYAKKGYEYGKSILDKKKKGGVLKKPSVFDAIKAQYGVKKM